MSLVRFEKTKNGFPCAINPQHVAAITFDGECSNVHLQKGTYVSIQQPVDEVISKLQVPFFKFFKSK